MSEISQVRNFTWHRIAGVVADGVLAACGKTAVGYMQHGKP